MHQLIGLAGLLESEQVFDTGPSGKLHIVGVGDAEPVVKPVAGGKEVGGVAQMPFAHDGGAVAFCFKGLSECDL